MHLRLENISKIYDRELVLDEVSFETESGKVSCLLGPSGSGKTTLLKIIAGLIAPDFGRIYINEKRRELYDGKTLRGVGFLFQDLRLFPHLSCEENCYIALNEQPKSYVEELCVELNISEHKHKLPHQVSRGQAQRFAIVRMLSSKPKIILMDEPTSSLDSSSKSDLFAVLTKFIEQTDPIVVIATHDFSVLSEFDSNVLMIKRGQLQQTSADKSLRELGRLSK